MKGLFRKQKEDDAISEELLAAIPDVGAGGRDDAKTILVHTAVADDEAPPARPARAAARAPAEHVHSPALGNALGQMRRQMEDAFARELDRVEGTMAEALRQMEERLQLANDRLTALRIENDELQKAKAGYERKLDALRQLALSDK